MSRQNELINRKNYIFDNSSNRKSKSKLKQYETIRIVLFSNLELDDNGVYSA